MPKSHAPRSELGWQEIGFLCESLAYAQRPFREAVRGVTERYALGPRGAWIIRVIAQGEVYPLDIARFFRVGRSLITAELARLSEAGLIATGQSKADGRRIRLSLTDRGIAASDEIQAELTRIIGTRLAVYSAEEVMLCGRLLRDLSGSEEEWQ